MNIGFYAKKDQLEHAYACYLSLNQLNQNIKITILVSKDSIELFKTRFESEKADIIPIEIPYILHEVPFMDKLYAASLYEYRHNQFIWIDVDSYFLQPFHDSLKDKGIFVNPVDIKNIGQSINENINDFWLVLLKLFDININTYNATILKTTVTDENIYPYYNMGFVIINDNKFIFSTAIDNFYHFIKDKIIKDYKEKYYLYMVFLHQVLFTLSLIKNYHDEDIHLLPPTYNYPLHLHNKKVSPLNIKEIHNFRYDQFFNHPDKFVLNELPLYIQNHYQQLKQ